MRSFRFAPVLALSCVFAFALAGCGGSDTVTPTPSGSPASRITFAGQYEGFWEAATEPDDKVNNRVTINGPATITVSDDGTFTAVLQNSTAYTYGVFTAKNKTHTLRGTVRESGYFTASVTVSETVNSEVVTTTNTVSGSLVKPINGGDRYRGTIALTNARVEIPGEIDLSRKN
ncbi:MAG: hypothetical protein H8F28_09090 [Fibrella sp.]|nr:hypothetical protein [Armatimonadota bacterium]